MRWTHFPPAFTRTPSRIEIELIKIVFTYEEASLAGQLTRTPETAAEIAKRVGLDEDEVTVLLESMIPRRMVRADTLALETGVKGLGKVEAQGSRREYQGREREEIPALPFPGGLVRILPAGAQAGHREVCQALSSNT